MRASGTLERQAEASEDDLPVQSIEIRFAIPMFWPQDAVRELHDLVSDVVKLKANQLHGHVHWVSGYGSKPLWSQADRAFLGLPPDSSAPAKGEPQFDDSVFEITTTCRPKHPGEK